MASVSTVHVIFKTHLDIGFTDLAANVIQRYTEEFIPKAIRLAEQLESRNGQARFIWTTGSWLIHHYLRQANKSQRAMMEEAISKGYIAWHGLPFTTHTELLDESLFEYGLSIATQLDQTYGKKTIAAKMTDVPGHTIAMVPHMQKAGIHYLHLGVNPASKKPSVPDVFRWQAQDGSEVIVNYAGNYGEALAIDGLQDVLVFAHTGDNCGPPSADDIQQQFEELARRYPGADIKASTMDAFAAKLIGVRDQLPVIQDEIGDTWIHGAATDPLKLAKFRELVRLRHKWLDEGKLTEGSEDFESMSEALLLVAEHTWGMDVKKFLPDFRHYAKAEFHSARMKDVINLDDIPDKFKYISSFAMNESDQLSKGLFAAEKKEKKYSVLEQSWQEQREYIDQAIQGLRTDMQQEARAALEQLQLRSKDEELCEAVEWKSAMRYSVSRFEVAFGDDGSIAHLADTKGKVWADEAHRIGVFGYETFGQENYLHWFTHYMENLKETHPWADADFGKPGFEYASPMPKHRLYQPTLVGLRWYETQEADLVVAALKLPQQAEEIYGAPANLEILYKFFKDSHTIGIDLFWSGKEACRLPEASWFSITPVVDDPTRWVMDKMGQRISPLHIVKDGNRNLHGIEKGVSYQGLDGSIAIESLDTAIVSPGERRLLQFNNTFAPLSQGMHFNLHNNIWGTNFPMWYEGDAKFRFKLEFNSYLTS
ncbi:glycoside hydrolase [Paenibacillus ferrarius]|uniref:Glycoside hydrolase n=1 Tax=Paenibacillus ferrarius TaxID=1469647 RepID=A0A1V4HCM8_9BACL|nr:DUF5054 domain-containing protein [Paenibacillus ferrarius]OPH49324.1 glycoside hydrolase [Paenibacillus ferrarius]